MVARVVLVAVGGLETLHMQARPVTHLALHLRKETMVDLVMQAAFQTLIKQQEVAVDLLQRGIMLTL
jgi:hypothetical protein